ncbi:lytic transglycosylase domain-containing protein [Nocardia callitridis]|uniref:Transglycosylase SLT domain-containing protein n=1 Tax=Nocardia callitridis TaxID=648753 RepID=A0ABP9JUG9_9NOCA
MGRHRKPQPATTRRNSSVLALTGLVPVGLVAVTAVTDIGGASSATASVQQQLPDGEAQQPVLAQQAAVAPIDIDVDAENSMAKSSPGAPAVVKAVALAEGRQIADLPAGPLDVPGVAVAAYKNAESILAASNPECAMPWSLLAGIGRVESHHANNGAADADGYPLTPVYGPVLDGSLSGNRAVTDTDGGALDGLSGYDRAIGPMQFLPQTWEKFGADGNGDGIADPQNLFDAALTSGRYLCDGGLEMGDLSQQSRAILRYNNSMAYVANVMAWETGYSTGVAPRPGQLPKI